MAGPDVEDLHRRIEDGSALENPFKLLRDVAHAYALATAGAIDRSDRALLTARELVIRLLAHRDRLGSAVALHDALVARLGLYAYLTETRLKGPELLAYEMHRPLGDFGEEMVWHRTQAVAYAHLLDGKSVILSAPTSFGKSRVIDGLVATGRYTDLLIIVPTVALIDEARRRLTRLAGDGYKVVTHSSQSPGERTIYVLTQERVLEFDQLPKIDLWVLDEFYKLALEEDADRTRLLNHAFYKLLQTGAPFYLLGPNIGGIGEPTLSQLDCVWIDSWDTTVAVDVIPIPKGGKKDDRLLGVCSQCVERNERSLVYCSGPNTAERVGRLIADAGFGRPRGMATDGGRWLGEHFHSDWRVVHALRGGVGVHHGQLPRAIGHYMISAFERGEINFLVCTSTLIEGVNTKAKNVIVYDQSIGRTRRPIDLFTFNNIRGRSGRMFSHVTGRVYLFKRAPEPPLKTIDFPILTQPEDASPELFMGIDEEDLGPRAKAILDNALHDSPVPVSVLEASPAVKLEDQIKLANAIKRLPPTTAADLSWSGPHPSWDQANAVFQLVWDEILGETTARPFAAASAAQLIKWISLLEYGDTRSLIADQIAFAKNTRVDTTILAILRFQRSGLTFEAPKWIAVVDKLQRTLLPSRGLEPGDYSAYIARLENLLLPPPLGSLDEYGIPIELARKLVPLLTAGDESDLDSVLSRLAGLDPSTLQLSGFEIRLIEDARQDLGVHG